MYGTSPATKQCFNCGHIEVAEAKFCGGCGAGWNFAGPQVPPRQTSGPNVSTPTHVPFHDSLVPAFAHVQQPGAGVSKELNQEAGKLMILLARERLFLYMHWIIFIGLNLLGCWLACKCYYEFIGDELSKAMVASTPFLFINSMALLCLVPIKGTRREITRLKEKLTYIRFKMEFGHLM